MAVIAACVNYSVLPLFIPNTPLMLLSEALKKGHIPVSESLPNTKVLRAVNWKAFNGYMGFPVALNRPVYYSNVIVF